MPVPRHHHPAQLQSRFRLVRNLLTTALAFVAGASLACSVPVYRYALERWAADPYGALVYHQGALDADQQKLVNRLSSITRAATEVVNLESHVVDLESEQDPQLLELWKKQRYATPPWVMLYYPRQSGLRDIVWSGPLNQTTVDRLIDSPARREIASRLLSEDSAVWVLIETGEKDRDEAAAKLLNERLARLETELKLPKILAQDVAEGLLNIPENELKISFSSLRISRADEAESIFLDQLLGMESDLRELREPIVFPVFGRGRALYALAGGGINAENIGEAASFLIGPCSCQVKDQNPGVDVLMAVDWDQRVRVETDLAKELPPLSGFLAPPTAEEPGPAPETAESMPSSAEIDDFTQSGTVSARAPDDTDTVNSGLLILSAMAAVVLLVGFFLFGRNA